MAEAAVVDKPTAAAAAPAAAPSAAPAAAAPTPAPAQASAAPAAAPAASPSAPAPADTVISASPSAEVDTTKTAAPTWGDDWRQKMAGEDAAAMKRLERFNSPADIFKSYRALEQRLSSGELKSALKPDATAEEVKAWRAENGIPDSPEGYKLELKNGVVVGEADKPFVDTFLKSAHAANLSNAQAAAAVEWYFGTVQAQSESRLNADKKIAMEAQDALRAEWGAEYRANINAATSLLDAAPAGLKDQFMRGRLADGTPIGSSVAALQWLSQLARELNPAATLVPSAGANTAGAIDTEIEGFEKKMKDRGSDYWKGPNAEKNQARYRELLAARERMKK